ncbi:MAG: hypothetical protein M1820_009386 [Bogoriella megaspora]|nr:MAG: hypothetical protein M1820_009386 [Bogoriella megaspora]
MIQNPPRAPTPLQPRPKAQPTSSSSGFAATAARASQPNLVPAQIRTRGSSKQSVDAASDDATAAFVRRTLCAHHVHGNTLSSNEKVRNTPKPVEELLPPLTSSNDTDLQLYAFIAIIIKEFVQSWYGKITPDHAFVDEVIQIIAHCTRALEQRLRKVDLEALLLDEIPELVDAHIAAYRLAHRPLNPPPLALNPRELYHQLNPHPALSPTPSESGTLTIVEQREHEEHWRQLVAQGVLAIILPTDDLENSCLRSLVTEVLSEMILGNSVGGKACEGWFIWEAITRILELFQYRATSVSNVEIELKPSSDAPDRLQQFGLLSSNNADSKAAASEMDPRYQKLPGSRSFTLLFWTIIQCMMVAFTALRTLVTTLARSSSFPIRSSMGHPYSSSTSASRQQASLVDGTYAPSPGTPATLMSSSAASTSRDRQTLTRRPVVSMRIWSCIGHLLEVESRMPWLAGLMALVHDGVVSGPGKVGDADGRLDRLLSYQFHTKVLNPAYLAPLLRALRTALFPNNSPAPARPELFPDEIAGIKRRCAHAIVNAVPETILRHYFRKAETLAAQSAKESHVWVEEVEGILDVFEDTYMNKHLMYGITELLVVRCFPEMVEKGVEELLADRLG